jgi:hypothetical protein
MKDLIVISKFLFSRYYYEIEEYTEIQIYALNLIMIDIYDYTLSDQQFTITHSDYLLESKYLLREINESFSERWYRNKSHKKIQYERKELPENITFSPRAYLGLEKN